MDTKYAFAVAELMFKLSNPDKEINLNTDLDIPHFKSFDELTLYLYKTKVDVDFSWLQRNVCIR